MVPSTAEDALLQLLDQGRERAAATCPDHVALWEGLAAATQGGKRFRPALVVAVHDALGGSRPRAAVRVAAAVELLHTAFVVHDDVIDGDDVRRGRLNVSGTFRARALAAGCSPEGAAEYALTAGILAGDLALAAAVRAVATCGAPGPTVARLLDLVDEALHATAAGELGDVRLSLETSATLEQSLAVAEQKTSAYSFSLPLQAGAVLAGAEEPVVTGLSAVGRTLGVAFQLVDDLIGVYGDPDLTGKSATSDLRTHKQTALLAHARSSPQWELVAPYLGRELTGEELTTVRELLTASGSRRFVEELAESHIGASRAAMAGLGLPPELLPPLSADISGLVAGEAAA